jgi:hypothetical protein
MIGRCLKGKTRENPGDGLKKHIGYISDAKLQTISVMVLCVMVAFGMTSNLSSIFVYGAYYSHLATTSTNYCGNGFLATEISCKNDNSIVGGDNNLVTSNGEPARDSSSSLSPDIKGDPDSARLQQLIDDQHTQAENNDSLALLDENIDQLPASTASLNDPTLLILPCCDEMPTVD